MGRRGARVNKASRDEERRRVHPHHDPCEQAHALATVRVRHHVPVADGEEGDGDKPHGAQEVTGHFLFVMIPGGTQRLGA